MSRRVQKMTLECREFNEIAAQSGGVSNHELSIYLRGRLHIADVSVIEVARDGDKVKVYLESSAFPELSCCFKSTAPELLVLPQGERSG